MKILVVEGNQRDRKALLFHQNIYCSRCSEPQKDQVIVADSAATGLAELAKNSGDVPFDIVLAGVAGMCVASLALEQGAKHVGILDTQANIGDGSSVPSGITAITVDGLYSYQLVPREGAVRAKDWRTILKRFVV